MIYFYSGTPGSGKSLNVARDIYNKLFLKKQNVIANFDINRDIYNKKKKKGEFFYVPNNELTPEFFYQYAKDHHKLGKESQTLVVIDIRLLQLKFDFLYLICDDPWHTDKKIQVLIHC